MPLEVKPLSKHVGAEVTGLDLHAPISEPTAQELRDAFAKYHLLLVRDPDVDEDEQSRFGEIFGEIKIRHRYANMNEAKKTQYVSNSRKDGILGDGEIHFHQDHTFYEKPLSAIMLYGVEVPQSGSATKFRKSGAILAKLPAEMRARAEGVQCLHLYNYQGDFTKWQDPQERAPGFAAGLAAPDLGESKERRKGALGDPNLHRCVRRRFGGSRPTPHRGDLDVCR